MVLMKIYPSMFDFRTSTLEKYNRCICSWNIRNSHKRSIWFIYKI